MQACFPSHWDLATDYKAMVAYVLTGAEPESEAWLAAARTSTS